MKKYIILFVIVVILAVFGIYYYNNFQKDSNHGVFCNSTVDGTCYRYTCNSGFISSRIGGGALCSDGSSAIQGEEVKK